MADAIKKLLRKIRQVPAKPLPPPEPIWKRLRAEAEAREYRDAFWERDKESRRKMAFEKAKLALIEYREQQRADKLAEELRQEEIYKQRVKAARKGRRVLQKMREGE